MNGMSGRRGAVLLVALIALVVLATAAPIVAHSGRPNNATWIKSGWKDSPVDVPATYGEIASLPLPKGKYAVSAKLWFLNTSGGDRFGFCRLRLGSSYDEIWQAVPDVSYQTVALQVVGRLDESGKAILECRDQVGAGGIQANWIKITAIKASRLRNVPLD